jgi:hypothetical protein
MSPLVPYTVKGEGFTFPSSDPEPDSPGRQHLLYSVNNEIRLHHDGDNREYLIKKRLEEISSFALFNDRPIDASRDELRDTESDKLIKACGCEVNALAVREGDLIYAMRREVHRAGNDALLGGGAGSVYGLTVYNNRFVHASIGFQRGDDESRILYTETNKTIAKRPGQIFALATHNGRLVHSETFYADDYVSRIFYTATEFLAEREGTVKCLAVYNGELIDASNRGKIRYTKCGGSEDPIVEAETGIRALLPIDEQTAERLLTLPEVREIE